MLVRPALAADDDAVLDLWRAARPDLDPATLPALLAAERRRDPELVLVAADGDGRVVGTVTGAFDGVRGWVRKMSVDAGARRAGVASALMAELERRFRELGALQVSLLVHAENLDGRDFWACLGYAEDDGTLYATKRFSPGADRC